MSKVNFSEEQTKAINSLNKNYIVSASAGSGKTFVLINRILKRVLEDNIDIDKILALTFTDNAASEMKKRLTKELNSISSTPYIEKQKSLLQQAHISSFHSFFLSIVKEYGYLIDVSENQVNNIIDEATKQIYKKEALSQCINDQIKMEDKSFYDLSLSLSRKLNDFNQLELAITSLSNFAHNMPNSKDYLTSLIVSNPIDSYAQLNDNTKNTYKEYISFICNSIIGDLNYLIDSIDNEKLIDRLNIIKSNLELAINYVNNEDIDSLYKVVNIVDLKGIRFAKLDDSANMRKNRFKKLLDILRDIVIKQDNLVLEFNNNMNIKNKLIELTINYNTIYSRIKKDNECIDFDDMEEYAHKILTMNNNYVASIYKEKFVDILIDEYQDTNYLQDCNIQLISRLDNIFRVGDIKQSIYGFRGAKPSIMKDLMLINDEANELITLSNNYRSKESVIDFNNTLYQKLMNIHTDNFNFSNVDIANTGDISQYKKDISVNYYKLNLIDEDKNEIKSNPIDICRQVAQIILEDKAKSNSKFSDYTILCESTTHFITLSKALNEVNIPNCINANKAFYRSNALAPITSLLKLAIDKTDEISLVAILLSPLFNISEEQLAKFKISSNDSCLYDHVNKYIDLSIVTEIRRDINNEMISNIFLKALNYNNYYDEYLNDIDKANIDYLYDCLLIVDKRQTSITEYINMIKLLENYQVDEASAINLNEDLLKATTIHKSKGLQYKKVILLCFNDSIRDMDIKNAVVFNETLGIGLNYISYINNIATTRQDFNRKLIAHKNKIALIEEKMRLLYVATTRAVDQLFIVSDANFSENNEKLSLVDIYFSCGFPSFILNNYDSRYMHVHYVNSIGDRYHKYEDYKNQETQKKFGNTKNTSTLAPSSTHKKYISTRLFDDEATATNYGASLHKVCELLENRQATAEEIEKIVIDNNLDRTINYTPILNLYNNEFFLSLLNNKVYKELSFISELDGTIVNGYIDFISISDNEAIIIDYKSDNKDISTIRNTHKSQILIYISAMRKILKKDIYGYIYSFKHNEFIEIK